MKAKALFYLRRYVNDLEDKAMFDQVKAAKSGLSYSERQARMNDADKYKDEYEALSWVFEQINKLPEKTS
jgi:hypothetical protein